jgi:hydrogenase nickel incorporation protein HypA/HybF
MHEMSLIADLMKKIETVRREQDANRVLNVRVRLGAMAHISAGHFREHFKQGCRGTAAENAHLEIEVSDDLNDPHAQDILLQTVEVGD